MGAGNTVNADGSITQTYSDGSYVTVGTDGSKRYFAPDGSEISEKSVTANPTPAYPNGVYVDTSGNGSAGGQQTSGSANNLAGRQWILDNTAASPDRVNIKQSDGTYSPETPEQGQKESVANSGSLGPLNGGFLDPGFVAGYTKGAVEGAGNTAAKEIGAGPIFPGAPNGSPSGGGGAGGPGVAAASANLGKFDPYKPVVPDRVTPSATAPVIAPPTPITSPTIDFTSGLKPPTIDDGRVSTVARPGAISAGNVMPTYVSPTSISAPGATPVQDVSVGGPGRAAQLSSIDYLKGVAQGNTKTSADFLLQKGSDQAAGAAYGAAAAFQGRNAGAALATGVNAAADVGAKNAADMGALKASEQQQAGQQLGTLGTAVAGQDLSALQSNQTKDLTLSVQTMQTQLKALEDNQANALAAGQSNQSADLASQIEKMKADLEAAKANQTTSLTADIANANNKMQQLTAELSAATATQNQDSINRIQAAIAALQAQIDTAKANLAATTTVDVTNATNATTTANANAGLEEKKAEAIAQQDAILKQLGLEALMAQLNAAVGSAKTQAEIDAATQSFWGQIAGTVGKYAAS